MINNKIKQCDELFLHFRGNNTSYNEIYFHKFTRVSSITHLGITFDKNTR